MIKIIFNKTVYHYFCTMKFGKIFLVYMLILFILGDSLKSSITFIYYELDPIGFIEDLCENKDKPELQCNGKCQLKKITDASSENPENPKSIIDFKQTLLFNEVFTYLEQTLFFYDIKQKFIYKNNYHYIDIMNHFRPPKTSSLF